MLRQDGDDDRGILRALALVNGRGVRRNQGVEFAETTGEHVPVETRGQFTFIGIDIVDIADVRRYTITRARISLPRFA